MHLSERLGLFLAAAAAAGWAAAVVRFTLSDDVRHPTLGLLYIVPSLVVIWAVYRCAVTRRVGPTLIVTLIALGSLGMMAAGLMFDDDASPEFGWFAVATLATTALPLVLLLGSRVASAAIALGTFAVVGIGGVAIAVATCDPGARPGLCSESQQAEDDVFRALQLPDGVEVIERPWRETPWATLTFSFIAPPSLRDEVGASLRAAAATRRGCEIESTMRPDFDSVDNWSYPNLDRGLAERIRRDGLDEYVAYVRCPDPQISEA